MANYEVNLKIADIVIKMESKFALEPVTQKEKEHQHAERFANFFIDGSEKPDILINVKISDKLPKIQDTKPVFITYHFQNGKENWRLLKKGNTYVYKSPIDAKKQLMLINSSFDKVTAYFVAKKMGNIDDYEKREFVKKHNGFVWAPSDIIYDFLQVLLINYFALRKDGIFTHAIGVKDLDNKGLLFAGKSGAGKSTTARIWHRHSGAMVLNDDRIIVRKLNGKFYIYGSPWHGEFSDYLVSRIESAPLKKIFFIYHSPKNRFKKVAEREAFSLLYPALFPAFWDRKSLRNTADFSLDLVKSIPCFKLGFVNDKRVIGFVRNVK